MQTLPERFGRLYAAFNTRDIDVVLAVSAGCASLRPVTRREAEAAALRNVCGSPDAARDSTCVIRGAEPIRGGYRVVLDRRPPAGHDRLALLVRRGGIGGGWAIEANEVDTSKAGQRK